MMYDVVSHGAKDKEENADAIVLFVASTREESALAMKTPMSRREISGAGEARGALVGEPSRETDFVISGDSSVGCDSVLSYCWGVDSITSG